jgi:hypothetical protein
MSRFSQLTLEKLLEEVQEPGVWSAPRAGEESAGYVKRQWERLVSPEERCFFQLCTEAILNPIEDGKGDIFERWLAENGRLVDSLQRVIAPEKRRRLRPFFVAHLLAAGRAARHWTSAEDVSQEAVSAIATETRLCPGFVFALLDEFAAEVSRGKPDRATRMVQASHHWRQGLTVEALLVLERPPPAEPDRLAAGLRVQTLSPGTGQIFPHPALALVYCYDDWTKSFEDAANHVKKVLGLQQMDRDICWRLEGRGQRHLPAELKGDSASGAFGLALACLLAGEGR